MEMRITIIIAAHNMEKYIEEALDSILIKALPLRGSRICKKSISYSVYPCLLVDMPQSKIIKTALFNVGISDGIVYAAAAPAHKLPMYYSQIDKLILRHSNAHKQPVLHKAALKAAAPYTISPVGAFYYPRLGIKNYDILTPPLPAVRR